MTASCLYEGWVRHRRLTPVVHEFRYPICLPFLDLSELPQALDASRWWSARRPAVAWFRRADYHGDAARPLADTVRDTVAQRTGERPEGPIRLLAHPRYLGHVFNPVSFYYCYDRSGDRVQRVLAEVTNTPWHERHAYVLAPDERRRLPKVFHVSPLMEMELDYQFRIPDPGERLLVHIESSRGEEKVFDATLSLERRELSPAALRRVLYRYPLMTMQVVAGIYFEALRLRLKGARWHGHPGRGGAAPAEREAAAR